MPFCEEPTSYTKGYSKCSIIADLQAALSRLRDAVAALPSSELIQQLLFTVDCGSRLEQVSNINQLKKSLLVINNIVTQAKTGQELAMYVEDIKSIVAEALSRIQNGDTI